jgi:hypothetical protein
MAAESELQEHIEQAVAVGARAYHEVMSGGEIQAAWRQGFNELGAALKAFPDAIQIDEPGAVFNPIYSDIASDMRSHGQAAIEGLDAGTLPSPSEIAMEGAPRGSVHGETQQASQQQDLPSPSQIADDNRPYSPEQDQGRDHGHDMGREM